MKPRVIGPRNEGPAVSDGRMALLIVFICSGLLALWLADNRAPWKPAPGPVNLPTIGGTAVEIEPELGPSYNPSSAKK